jgi:outer membrane protein assembly factor BamB
MMHLILRGGIMRQGVIALIVFHAATMMARAEDWPQWRGPRGDGTWNGPPIAAAWPAGAIHPLWSAEVGGGYSGVTVAEGRVYLMDRLAEPREVERVLCFDAESGRRLWTHEYDAEYGRLPYGNGPRASVTIRDGMAYTFGAVGHAHALEAATGKVLWSIDTEKRLGARRPEWGFAGSPVIHGRAVLLHIGAPGQGCLVALDRANGQELWRGGDDAAGYNTPILFRHAGTMHCVIWAPNRVISLDPDTGKTWWQFDYPIRYGVSIASPIFQQDTLLVASYWHGARALKLGAAPADTKLAWSDEHQLRGLMSQPLYSDGHVYMLDKDHGLTCFELATGRKLWDDDNRTTPAGRNPQASLIWTGRNSQALILNSDGQLILARLTPAGCQELARAPLIDKTWAHPAFWGDRVFARSDKRLVAARLPTIAAD